MGERLRKFNCAISLYTEALDSAERQHIPTLSPPRSCAIDPGTWPIRSDLGRVAEQLICGQRDDEMASAAVIERGVRRSSGLSRKIPPRRLGVDDAARDVGGDY